MADRVSGLSAGEGNRPSTGGTPQATRSASIQSTSERAPLLSPSQRRRNGRWSAGPGQVRQKSSWWQRLTGRGGAEDDEDGEDEEEDQYALHERRQQETSRRLIRALFALLIVMVAAVTIAVVRQEYIDRQNPHWGSGRPYAPKLAKGRSGAVAAEEERCSQIGVDGAFWGGVQMDKGKIPGLIPRDDCAFYPSSVLKEGGNAVDAAIASTLCTGVINMYSSGIGGGGFMIVRDPRNCTKSEKKKHGLTSCSDKVVIDFRETAPAGAYPSMYVNKAMAARWGGLAVGVPGELRGLEMAHKRFGKLPWSRLFAPAIKLAEGTYVSRELDARLKRFGFFFVGDSDWSSTFINPDTGLLVKRGDRIQRKQLAKVLQDVAQNGSRAFYEGSHAKSIVDKVQSRGGILTLEDMSRYRAVARDAIEGTWYGRRVFTTPAPTSGPVLLSMLQVLSLYKDWLKAGIRNGTNMHRMIESMKFASAQRTRIGDPAFLDDEALADIDEISTMKEAKRVHARINSTRTYDIEYYEPLYDVQEQHGTMHLGTLDKDGMAVALTSTVNLPFGSAVMDPETGVILNDEMDDSSTPGVPNAFGLFPSPYNYPQPHKRPLSSTAPTIVERADGSFYVTIGGSGGSRIFGSVAQVLLNMDWGLDVSQAIERPRLHHQLLPTSVSAESTIDPQIVDALEARGHEVQFIDINSAVAEVQAIVAEQAAQKGTSERYIYAASDSRKGGIAVAY